MMTFIMILSILIGVIGGLGTIAAFGYCAYDTYTRIKQDMEYAAYKRERDLLKYIRELEGKK